MAINYSKQINFTVENDNANEGDRIRWETKRAPGRRQRREDQEGEEANRKVSH